MEKKLPFISGIIQIEMSNTNHESSITVDAFSLNSHLADFVSPLFFHSDRKSAMKVNLSLR